MFVTYLVCARYQHTKTTHNVQRNENVWLYQLVETMAGQNCHRSISIYCSAFRLRNELSKSDAEKGGGFGRVKYEEKWYTSVYLGPCLVTIPCILHVKSVNINSGLISLFRVSIVFFLYNRSHSNTLCRFEYIFKDLKMYILCASACKTSIR